MREGEEDDEGVDRPLAESAVEAVGTCEDGADVGAEDGAKCAGGATAASRGVAAASGTVSVDAADAVEKASTGSVADVDSAAPVVAGDDEADSETDEADEEEKVDAAVLDVKNDETDWLTASDTAEEEDNVDGEVEEDEDAAGPDEAVIAADGPVCIAPAAAVDAFAADHPTPLYPLKLNPAGAPVLVTAAVGTTGGSGTTKQVGGNSCTAIQPATPLPASASPPTASIRC